MTEAIKEQHKPKLGTVKNKEIGEKENLEISKIIIMKAQYIKICGVQQKTLLKEKNAKSSKKCHAPKIINLIDYSNLPIYRKLRTEKHIK